MLQSTHVHSPHGFVYGVEALFFEDYEDGNAYVDETWGDRDGPTHTMQRQLRLMFDRLRLRPDDVLSGVFVPFRSPTWAALRGMGGDKAKRLAELAAAAAAPGLTFRDALNRIKNRLTGFGRDLNSPHR